MNLYTNLVAVEKGNRQSLLNALEIISDFDCDFNGDNGIDYLWDDAEGFESNLDYLLNEVKDIEEDEEVVKSFIEEWMDRDSNYYTEYSYNTITEDGFVVAISLSAVSNY